MKTGTVRLLEKALKVTSPGRKYGLAKRLAMNPANLNKALAGRLNIGPKHAVLLAEVLDLEPVDVLAVTQHDAARTPEEREFWGRKVPRFLAAFSLGLMLVASPQAECRNAGLAKPEGEAIYIMRPRKRMAA